jgi:hypothetical protein
MTGVITPVETGNKISPRSQIIHYAPFAFITPLGTDDDI